METSTCQELIANLSFAKEAPLLIEIQGNVIDKLIKDDNCFSLLDVYRSNFDVDQKGFSFRDKALTNIIYINAKAGRDTQLLQGIYSLVSAQLKNSLRLDVVFKTVSVAGVDLLGDLIAEPMADVFSYSKEFFNGDLWNPKLVDKASDWLDKKSEQTIMDKAEELGESAGDRLNIKQQFGNKLYLTTKAEKELLVLASALSSKETPHQIMQFIFELLSALSLGAPKLIVINNPQYLDSASISILSILFSYAKDKKQQYDLLNKKDEQAFNGLSVVFQYTEKTLEASHKIENSQSLRHLKNMAQRYGMLEKIGSTMPISAIRSTTFIGRQSELEKLSTEHHHFIESLRQQSVQKPRQGEGKPSQWTLIKGEPGVGKTALINHHLHCLFNARETPTEQIRLRLLNQVGHSSETTGLASMQHAIQAELKRLINSYQLNHSFQSKLIKDKVLEVKKSFQLLANGAVSLSRKLDQMIYFTASTVGYGSAYKAAKSGYRSFTFDSDAKKTGETLGKEHTRDAKKAQFDLLDEALYHLHVIAKSFSSDVPPILIFVDDLQWIDELSSEYIMTRLMVKYPSQILFTARRSDSISAYKKAQHNQADQPYKIMLFDSVKIIESSSNSVIKSSGKISKNISLTSTIDIKGMDKQTLSELIKKTYLNTSIASAKLIASQIIHGLSPEQDKDDQSVVTLFAIEALNLFSDKLFYKGRLANINPLFSKFKRGVYLLNETNEKTLIKSFKQIFSYLENVYAHAYCYETTQGSEVHSFTLSSYAIMEERLMIIHQYFGEHGDIVLFSLQLSVLVGSPFYSELVCDLVCQLSQLEEDEKSELLPIKSYIQGLTNQELSAAHFDRLDKAFEILKRIDEISNRYKYQHSLFDVFLRKQMEYNLHSIFGTDSDAIHHFLSYCIKVIDNMAKVELDTKVESYLNDPQLNICIFGFNLSPNNWYLLFSERLSNYGSSVPGNTLARKTSYYKMAEIIPLQEKLITYFESIELCLEDKKLYAQNLYDIAQRYFAMNGELSVLHSADNNYRDDREKYLAYKDKFSSCQGIDTIKKLLTVYEELYEERELFDDQELYIEALIILTAYYRNNKKFREAVPFQVKLLELNDSLQYDKIYCFIYLSKAVALSSLYVEVNDVNNVLKLQRDIFDVFENLRACCTGDGKIGDPIFISPTESALSDPFYFSPINDVSTYSTSLINVSLLFFEWSKKMQNTDIVFNIIDFYNENCFSESDFFIKGYLQLVMFINQQEYISDQQKFLINNKTIDWYEQAEEEGPDGWYMEYGYVDDTQLRKDNFIFVTIKLLDYLQNNKPSEINSLLQRIVGIGCNLGVFLSADGLGFYLDVMQFKQPDGSVGCLSKLKFYNEITPISLIYNVNGKNLSITEKVSSVFKDIYIEQILPLSTTLFLIDKSTEFEYSDRLSEFALICLMTKEYRFSNIALHLSLKIIENTLVLSNSQHSDFFEEVVFEEVAELIPLITGEPILKEKSIEDISDDDELVMLLDDYTTFRCYKHLFNNITQLELSDEVLIEFAKSRKAVEMLLPEWLSFVHVSSEEEQNEIEFALVLSNFDEFYYSQISSCH